MSKRDGYFIETAYGKKRVTDVDPDSVSAYRIAEVTRQTYEEHMRMYTVMHPPRHGKEAFMEAMTSATPTSEPKITAESVIDSVTDLHEKWIEEMMHTPLVVTNEDQGEVVLRIPMGIYYTPFIAMAEAVRIANHLGLQSVKIEDIVITHSYETVDGIDSPVKCLRIAFRISDEKGAKQK